MTMENEAKFIDSRSGPASNLQPWPALVVRREKIEAALDALLDGEPGEDRRREVSVAHPHSGPDTPGLAPSVNVRFGLVKPGEPTRRLRTNASSYFMALSGSGRVRFDRQDFELSARDSINLPSMMPHTIEALGDQPFRYVSYSNAALLQKLEALYLELDPPQEDDEAASLSAAAQMYAGVQRAKHIAGPAVPLGDGLGQLLPYEHLIDPDSKANPPLMWPWKDVAGHLGLFKDLSADYNGRPLWCLYNPSTERRNGTTHCFFATIASAPANVVGPAHRHMSAAINYILDGGGWSIIDGRRVEWSAGDIMLSAPGWATHGHAIGPEGAVILTIQDHPLHIAAESLIWQEDVKAGPILTLGVQAGFQTNLAHSRAKGS